RRIPESPWGSPIPIRDGDGDVNRFPDGDGDGDGDEDEKRGWGWILVNPTFINDFRLLSMLLYDSKDITCNSQLYLSHWLFIIYGSDIYIISICIIPWPAVVIKRTYSA
ncbi:hypothetical protein Tco_1169774, partial [Tanacetum coccineum]